MWLPITRSNAVGWQFIQNKTALGSTKDLQTANPKSSKIIRRRTKILNKELKKIGRLKSYSQYVKIKTNILNKVSDDESVEEEPSEMDGLAGNLPSEESICVPGPSNTKASRARKDGSKTVQRDKEITNTPKKPDVSKAKKNLTGLLENLEKSIARKSEPGKPIRRRAIRKPRIPVNNLPPGDSGIEDNSQASPSNDENETGPELEDVGRFADRLSDQDDDSQTPFTQVNRARTINKRNEDSSAFQSKVEESSLFHSDINDDEETLDEAKDVEELSEAGRNENGVEEPASRDATPKKSSQSDENEINAFESNFQSDEEDEQRIEETSLMENRKKLKKSQSEDKVLGESPKKGPVQKSVEDKIETFKSNFKSDEDEQKTEELPSTKRAKKFSQSDTNETFESDFRSDEDEQKMKKPSATQRVKKFSHSEDKDIGESPTKKKEVASPHKEENVMAESLAKEEEKFETLSQADESADGIEAIATEEKSLINISEVADTKDNTIDAAWAEEEETAETSTHSDANDDSLKKKNQPTIMCTEIVTAKYMIIRDDDEEEEKEPGTIALRPEIMGNAETTEADELSSEADRVSKLKRINLLCSGTESDSSDEDDGPEHSKVQAFARPPLSSQVISDPSDSEDSDSLELHISDSEDGKVTSTPYCQPQKNQLLRSEGLPKKSIKDQIKEQSFVGPPISLEDDAVDDTTEEQPEEIEENEGNPCPEAQECEPEEKVDNAAAEQPVEIEEQEEIENQEENPCPEPVECETDDTPKRKKSHKNKSHDSEALQYVLKNISKRNSDNEELAEAGPRNEEENLPRPTELHEFVAREDLIPTEASSTLTLKDISKISQDEEDDEEIWLMEIPKSIVTDPGLRGQSIVIQKNQIKIGEINYNVSLKHTKAVSCILRKNERKSRYKAVNIRPVYSINVRHERAHDEQMSVSKPSPATRSVPFPTNIKSRNPLIAECNGELVTSENSPCPIAHEKQKSNRQSGKKRKHSLWHMDNFILKRRRKKIDGSWADGSKDTVLFNE